MKKDKCIRQIRKGNPDRLGVTRKENGYNFAVSVPEGAEAFLLLYVKGEEEPAERIPLVSGYFTGRVAAVFVDAIDGDTWEYNYEIDGNVVLDPYAAAVTGCERLGDEKCMKQPHKMRCRFAVHALEWEETFPPHPLSESIFYKLHVRGFTMGKDGENAKKGTFSGLMQEIAYLKNLGITAVELMPAYEFRELSQINAAIQNPLAQQEEYRLNYWGYTSDACYMAPKAAYCYTDDPVQEMRDLICALHQNGIECVMEFYFGREILAGQILDILHYWKCTYHVDGFHLIGDGVLQDIIRQDPLLSKTKLFFTAIHEDASEGPSAAAYKNCAEYNEGFRQVMKRYLKGDEDLLESFAFYARRNPASYGQMNYLTIQDGFTLRDSVSYEEKRNAANGEGNRDGIRYNYSWNCGAEGETEDSSVCRLRKQLMKNAVLLLMLSQGTPLWYQGDELGNSQQGNNNAYCQDNPVGWVDWSQRQDYEDLREFLQSAIAFRMAHPVLRREAEPRTYDYKMLGYPELSYHNKNAWLVSYENHLHHLGVMYYGGYAKKADSTEDDSIYIAYNMHWNPHEFELPYLPKGEYWYPVMDTSQSDQNHFAEECKKPVEDGKIEVPPRAVVVLVGKAGER